MSFPKEYEAAVFDMRVLQTRCEQASNIVSAYVHDLLMLVVPSDWAGVRLSFEAAQNPMPSEKLAKFLNEFKPINSWSSSADSYDAAIVEINSALDELQSLHRARSKISYELQCAYADHMSKLWKNGFTIQKQADCAGETTMGIYSIKC